MTRILAFLRRLYADIQHNNRLAQARHNQENKQKIMAQPRRHKKKGWQR